MAKNARVDIGMPVYNGEKYLRQSIGSILGQTFKDFELFISDNASTDNTQKICKEYADQDPRVHYYRNEKNIGGPKNYNRVFSFSSSEFFKWAAYDDVLAPEYLEKCIEMLDKYPSIVGCHCKTGRIDENGTFLGYYNNGLLKNINSPKAHARFRDLMGLVYTTTPFHGVYRRSLFAKSQLHGSYIGADRNLVAELSLMGPIYEIPECLFFWRDHPDSYTSIFYGSKRNDTLSRLKAESAWWSKESGTFFPHWQTCSEYIKSVKRIPLKRVDRFLCYSQILGWILSEGRKYMFKDLVLFMAQHSVMAGKLMESIPVNLRGSLLVLSKK